MIRAVLLRTLGVLLLTIPVVNSLLAQSHPLCGTDAFHQQYLSQDSYALEKWENFIQDSRSAPIVSTRETIDIPVVFHIVYRTEEQNISDEIILDQVDIINSALQSDNRSHPGIPDIFRSLVASLGVRLCLTEPVTGGKSRLRITRHRTNIVDIGKYDKQRIKYSALGGVDSWDTNKYLNIWVGEIGNNLLGYSTFPDKAGTPMDGIVIDVRFLQANSSPYNLARTLIHEMGHYLGLCHLPGCFTASCDVDDNVEDTPNQSHYYNQEICPEGPQISCESLDMYMNYMALSPDRCLLMFTQGQRKLTRFTLNVMRPQLTETACSDTGTTQSWKDELTCHYSNSKRALIITSKITAPEGWAVDLYNITGQLIARSTISYRKRLIFERELPRGHYIVYFYGPKTNFYKKIIVF